jgi:hypothetical protein
MAGSFDIFSFAFTAEHMAAVDGPDKGRAGRVGPHPTLSAGFRPLRR